MVNPFLFGFIIVGIGFTAAAIAVRSRSAAKRQIAGIAGAVSALCLGTGISIIIHMSGLAA